MISALQADAGEVKILQVLVRDANFEVIRVIEDTRMIQRAEQAWRQLKPIDRLPSTQWTHKLDVTSEAIGGRWLYNKEGYLARLNKQLTPSYRVSDVKTFNEIFLGL